MPARQHAEHTGAAPCRGRGAAGDGGTPGSSGGSAARRPRRDHRRRYRNEPGRRADCTGSDGHARGRRCGIAGHSLTGDLDCHEWCLDPPDAAADCRKVLRSRPLGVAMRVPAATRPASPDDTRIPVEARGLRDRANAAVRASAAASRSAGRHTRPGGCVDAAAPPCSASCSPPSSPAPPPGRGRDHPSGPARPRTPPTGGSDRR